MTFHIVTIFPEMFDSYLKESILGRAIKNKKIKVKFYNPRDFVRDKHKQVDDKPYGGGPGMVLMAEPILKAIKKALSKGGTVLPLDKNFISLRNAKGRTVPPLAGKFKIIILSPGGKEFTNKYARTLAKSYTDIVLIAGRYEGIDARVKKILRAEYGARKVEEISIGDYILSGGELPAMVIMEAVSRQIPGVLGKKESLEEERIATSEVYTRPEVIEYPPPRRGKKGPPPRKAPARRSKKYKVPKVLLSGHHKEIKEWKKKHRR